MKNVKDKTRTSNQDVVVSVRGSVVDVKFDHHLPPIHTLLHADEGRIASKVLPLDDACRRDLAAIAWPTRNLPEVINNREGSQLAFVREYILVSLFRACAESQASENANRLEAMQRAEKISKSCWKISIGPTTACVRVLSTRNCLILSLASKQWQRFRDGRKGRYCHSERLEGQPCYD